MRVSTAQQAEHGVSLDDQRARIQSLAAAHGWRLGHTYADEGISGRKVANRPGLADALAHVTRERGVLVVHSLSRLARSTRDCIDIADRLERDGADLVSVSERIDTTSAAGKLFFTLMAAIARFESDQLGERVAAAMACARSNGRLVSGPNLPYGFDLVSGTKQLTPNPREQAVLRLIERWRRAGWSVYRIANHLNALAVPSKRGLEWRPATVYKVLERYGRYPLAAGK